MDYGLIFANVGTDALAAVTSVVPIAVPVLGAMLAIGVAIKVIRKVAK